jgi:hypothetical protein
MGEKLPLRSPAFKIIIKRIRPSNLDHHQQFMLPFERERDTRTRTAVSR